MLIQSKNYGIKFDVEVSGSVAVFTPAKETPESTFYYAEEFGTDMAYMIGDFAKKRGVTRVILSGREYKKNDCDVHVDLLKGWLFALEVFQKNPDGSMIRL